MEDLIKRSDAIEQLNEAISICPPCMKGTGIYRTSALEEAIDIINQIPSADRPSAVDLSSVCSTAYKSGYDKGYADAVQGISDELVKQGKHIEADRPQGEWETEYHGNGWNDYWDYTCSNCGKKYERADAVLYKANFCPNCGANMKGADDE